VVLAEQVSELAVAEQGSKAVVQGWIYEDMQLLEERPTAT